MKITQELIDRMVDHARADLPDECCGLVASKDGIAMATIPMENVKPSSGFFQMHPFDTVDVFQAIVKSGLEVGAFYHSHPSIEPVPSCVDVQYAAAWPGVVWIIIGRLKWLSPEDQPDVWAWRIRHGRIFTAELEVVD